MSGPGAHAGNNVGDAVRKGVGMVHGAGEAIRGNINAAVDSAAGHQQGVARDEAIASRGADEMDTGYHRHNTSAGVAPSVAPTSIAREQPTRMAPSGYGTQTGPMNYGPYDTNVGNKVDPRVDSNPGTRRV